MTKPIKSLNLFCLPVTFYVNKTNFYFQLAEF